MSTTGHARASHSAEEEDALKRAAPDTESHETTGIPAVPDLEGGHLDPEAWLALQQAIGNNAVGGMLERRRKTGQPLPPRLRHDMETSFGRDFGQVELHTGPEVDEAAQDLGAAAFTVADDIFVHSELPGPDHPLGRQVLGEELAHVTQGVGQEGVARVTDPAEMSERQAHAAGLAAAAGEPVNVGAAPEAAGAVARYTSPSEALIELGEIMAAATEKRELSNDEKDRLAAGALMPLLGLWPKLIDQLTAATNRRQSAKVLTSIAENSDGISSFILSFSGTPAVQPTIESAATAVVTGRQALLAAIDPHKAIKGSAGILAALSGEISALAVGPQPTGTPPVANPAGQAAPAAQTDTLSAAEADQLQTGAAEPLKSASDQLSGEEPQLDLIIARLQGIPTILRSISKPAALVPQLRRKAIDVEGQIARLQAVVDGPQAALAEAVAQWGSALSLLAGLVAKAASGTATGAAQGAASDGSDEDKKKSAQ